MKSVTPSTLKAARSTLRAVCATGGHHPDLAHFDAATAKLAAQYDTYMPFPDLHVNGKQTLAEDIADVAGISAAYDGYHASLGGKTAPEQDGFSGDQQFFIAFGQNWGSKTRSAALRRQVMTDPHAPAEYRADYSAKYRRLVCRLRCEARTDTVPGSSGSCSHLVNRNINCWRRLVPVLNVRPKGGEGTLSAAAEIDRSVFKRHGQWIVGRSDLLHGIAVLLHIQICVHQRQSIARRCSHAVPRNNNSGGR